jgi:hypothetical protein
MRECCARFGGFVSPLKEAQITSAQVTVAFQAAQMPMMGVELEGAADTLIEVGRP